MKHIKKFDTLNQADGYVIPNPFVGYVENGQLIANSEDDKKLEVEGGQIVITDAVTLISFTIDGDTYQAEQGMKWENFVNSKYDTTNQMYIQPNYGYVKGDEGRYLMLIDDGYMRILKSEEILNNGIYEFTAD